MILEHRGEYDSEPGAICAISSKIGCHYDTLQAWLRQHRTDVRGGVSPISSDDRGLTIDKRQSLRELERENRELRRSNDILRQVSAYFARPPLEKIMPHMQRLSGTHGVGPVCRELDIAPSTYHWHQQRRLHPEKCRQREKRDGQISQEIKRVYEENYRVYGARKVWRQLLREDFSVARCTVERLMKIMGFFFTRSGSKELSRSRGVRSSSVPSLVLTRFAEYPLRVLATDLG